MAEPKMIKVKSTHPESQGPFVLMDEAAYDPKVHTLHVEDTPGHDKQAAHDTMKSAADAAGGAKMPPSTMHTSSARKP